MPLFGWFRVWNWKSTSMPNRYSLHLLPVARNTELGPSVLGGIGDARIRARARAPPWPTTPSSSASGGLASDAAFFPLLPMYSAPLLPPHARAVVEAHPCPGSSSPMAEVELPCGRDRVSPTPPSACAPQARRLPLCVRPKPDASLSACALSLTPLLVRLRRSSSLAPRSSSPGSGGLSFFLCSYRKGLVVRWR